jgi:hypothetical protein
MWEEAQSLLTALSETAAEVSRKLGAGSMATALHNQLLLEQAQDQRAQIWHQQQAKWVRRRAMAQGGGLSRTQRV